MDLCPYDQTPLDVIGKKEYIGPMTSPLPPVRVTISVRVFLLCHTCGKHFHRWTEHFESEELETVQ